MNEYNNPEIRPDNKTGLGILLKTEREKKGLSISQVAGITKLRKHFIEALENEEWEKLPAIVFVKGFIRSYALSIDLDVNEAIRLFEISAPQMEEENFSKALITAEKKKSKTIYLLIPLLALAGIFFYFASGWDWNKSNITEPEITPIYKDRGPETTETAGPAKQSVPESREDSTSQQVIQKPEITPADLQTIPPEEEKEENLEAVIEIKNIKDEERQKAELKEEALHTDEPPPGNDLQEDIYNEEREYKYFLKAKVSMLTYLKIYVDDNPPKIYMFRPGRTPDWKASKGFYIIVGNAAGIEFDFNGREIKDLGKEGKVKTLRFPKDFISKWEE
jgi:cytoskeleton protein RodZ